jgi:hypothetical protein
MVTDDEIADLFERTAQDLDPAVGMIVAKAERMGRRLRFRRRFRIAVGSSIAVAAVAGAGLAGMSLASSSLVPGMTRPAGSHATAGLGGRPADGGRLSPSPAGGRKPAHQPTAAPGESSGEGMTQQQMLATLRRLLPSGGTLSDVRTSTARGSLEVDYNDGQGAVDLMISVNPTTLDQQALRCPHPLWTDEGRRPAGALPLSCTMRTLPDGSIERDAVMYADSAGFYGYDIYNQRPDGTTVFIQVGNGIIHTVPQVDRPRPPGSMAQWRAIAENPAWRL